MFRFKTIITLNLHVAILNVIRMACLFLLDDKDQETCLEILADVHILALTSTKNNGVELKWPG